MSSIKVTDIDPSGLDMYREVDYFNGGIKEAAITIWYYEWLVTPNGYALPAVRKKYYVKDIPAVTKPGDPVLVTPAELDENGNEITPAVYAAGDPIIITPANNGYTSWRRKVIVPEMVGATLGDDIIIGAINQTLAGMPVDVPDGHIVVPDK